METGGSIAGGGVALDDAKLARVRDALLGVREGLLEMERGASAELAQVHADRVVSAKNFLHYLGLRRRDLRSLQEDLRSMGLSSLGRSEGAVLGTLDAMLALVSRALGEAAPGWSSGAPTAAEGRALLDEQTVRLLGPRPEGRYVRTMVTMPSAAAGSRELVRSCLESGMDLMRINCAHDDERAWSAMIGHLAAAREETGRRCGVYMDLAGPKLRTGRLAEGLDAIPVRVGDEVVLTASGEAGRGPVFDGRGNIVGPAVVACTLPEALGAMRVGHPVWFDDGKVGAEVVSAGEGEVVVRVTQTRASGGRLRADKGINLPETELELPALTESDLGHIPFVCAHADVVGLSFVRRPSDLDGLEEALEGASDDPPGVVLKIENREAFENLPALLMHLMRTRVGGVMIARGDLAVECGWERLAEVQEEILWMCEASHTPVIWATQVLESLAKKGQPTRSEVTDAAMSERAECVMLNKGPYIVRAIRMLDDILRRMQEHQSKKIPTLRALGVAQRYSPGG